MDALQAQKLFDMYKNRWTVDTSYRMVGQVRMNSKTLDFAVRWFLFFFSLIIINGYWLFNDFNQPHVNFKGGGLPVKTGSLFPPPVHILRGRSHYRFLDPSLKRGDFLGC